MVSFNMTTTRPTLAQMGIKTRISTGSATPSQAINPVGFINHEPQVFLTPAGLVVNQKQPTPVIMTPSGPSPVYGLGNRTRLLVRPAITAMTPAGPVPVYGTGHPPIVYGVAHHF